MRILIVSDAAEPQVNGVVTTLNNLIKVLEQQHTITVLTPAQAQATKTLSLYPDIQLGWVNKQTIANCINNTDAVHISTPEGPIGFRVMRYCVKNNIPFTTGYHTKWPEFISARFPIPQCITYAYMRWIHKHSKRVLVPSEAMCVDLQSCGFNNVSVWTRGVDRTVFKPIPNKTPNDKKILLCVSRVSKEKNIEDFCKLQIPNTRKILVGDGPHLNTLKQQYTDVEYAGLQRGSALAEYYAMADVFVFPSRVDTFGVVMIESMACGTPVAAYPVTGPIDVVDHGKTGILNYNLETAIKDAFNLNRDIVVEQSKDWTWEKCAKQFVDSLVKKSI